MLFSRSEAETHRAYSGMRAAGILPAPDEVYRSLRAGAVRNLEIGAKTLDGTSLCGEESLDS